ncbi:MAG: DUF4344 domain-containing metallopeptidase [Thermodesulfobacteriota bacterium]
MGRPALFLALCGLAALALACPPARAGEVRVSYGPGLSSTPELEACRQDRAFETLAENIAAVFVLPRDLTLRVSDCGEPNACYEAENASILVCGEILPEFAALAARMEPDPDAALDLFYDNLLFTVYHELGHALVDILDLPITGREEDVADQAAAWLMLETLEEGAGLAATLNAASFFYAPPADGESQAFWDTHGLDIQRLHNILCWAYGFDPDQTSAALGADLDALLPPERREFCPEEYARMHNSFLTLLGRSLRQ